MNLIKLASVLFFFTPLIFPSTVFADNYRARIVRVQGQVYVVNAEGERRQANNKSFLVNSNETVVTQKGSKAVLHFDDGTVSVMGQKSSLRVEQSGWLSQFGGKIYYAFRKVLGKNKPKQVKTRFSTIGIRGTTFIVDADNPQIALKEGKLNIESPGDDYEIYKPVAIANDFADFKEQARQENQAMNDEYQDYKKDIRKEFVEYKKSFDLEANKVISFNGNRVDESDLNKDWDASFDEFANFSKDLSDEFKEFDREAE